MDAILGTGALPPSLIQGLDRMIRYMPETGCELYANPLGMTGWEPQARGCRLWVKATGRRRRGAGGVRVARHSRRVRYRSCNEMVFSAKYRVVFCPKYRRGVLVGGVGCGAPLHVVRRYVENQLRDFQQACRSWWAGTHRRPRLRKRGLDEGFCVRDVTCGSSTAAGRSWCPKGPRAVVRVSRPLPAGKLGMARVTLDGKRRWHVSFPARQPPVARERTGAVVGIDRGVRNTLATSDGRMLRAPVIASGSAGAWRVCSSGSRVSAKVSQRRRRTRQRIAALHQTVRDRRRDWIEIQTTRLVPDHDLIAVEKLNVKGMVRRPQPKRDPERDGAFLPNGAAAKSGLNRSIHQQGWSQWLHRLYEKAHTSGVEVASRPGHTSQQCRACGHTAAASRESQAVFCCESCGHPAHADREAAENILARALALAPTPGPGASTPIRVLPAQDANHGAAGTPRRARRCGLNPDGNPTAPSRGRRSRTPRGE